MLTLEACKALKDMGYQQDDGALWWSQYRDRAPRLLTIDGLSGMGDPQWLYACPDSHDALEWLSKKLKENHLIRLMDSPELGPEWMKVADRYIIHAYPTDLWAYTPSDLILRVAERQCLPS
jgi:hypothetical protein